MKWGVNEAERSGGLFQMTGAAKKVFSLFGDAQTDRVSIRRPGKE